MKQSFVEGFAEFWPREIFDIREGKDQLLDEIFQFKGPGVYILYRDDEPYYIGKSEKSVSHRLHQHANISESRYSRHWNYFSVFMVNSIKDIPAIEGILIAAIPKAANSSKTKMPKIKFSNRLRRLLSLKKRISVNYLLEKKHNN